MGALYAGGPFSSLRKGHIPRSGHSFRRLVENNGLPLLSSRQVTNRQVPLYLYWDGDRTAYCFWSL